MQKEFNWGGCKFNFGGKVSLEKQTRVHPLLHTILHSYPLPHTFLHSYILYSTQFSTRISFTTHNSPLVYPLLPTILHSYILYSTQFSTRISQLAFSAEFEDPILYPSHFNRMINIFITLCRTLYFEDFVPGISDVHRLHVNISR